MDYIWVGIAGIVGTWLRYGLGLLVQPSLAQPPFPIGTLTVNLIGCFALGWFSQWGLGKIRLSARVRFSISTGLIGSFTTSSTFSVETVQWIRQGWIGSALVYAGTSLIGGLCLVWLGTRVASRRERAKRG